MKTKTVITTRVIQGALPESIESGAVIGMQMRLYELLKGGILPVDKIEELVVRFSKQHGLSRLQALDVLLLYPSTYSKDLKGQVNSLIFAVL